MLFYTVGQARVFLSMLYAGLLIGAWYDVLRFVRYVLEAGKLLTAILDGVFALGMGVILIASMLLVNYGDMRVYCLLGACCGMVLYGFTVGPLLRLVVVKPGRFVVCHLRAALQRPWAKKIFR